MAPSAEITPPPSRSGPPTGPDKACLDSARDGADRLQDHASGRWIKLPEALFSSIMSVEPAINPLHGTSKALSDAWLRNALQMDEKTASIWSKMDIAYMSAISAPGADVEALKLMNDWNGWVFAFDDPFDEGGYDPIKAAEEVVHTLSMLDDVHPEVSPEENPYRWKRHLMLYCIGVLQQVGVQHEARKLTVQEYMDMRAGCVGAYPCIGLMELAEGIDLPQYVVDHPSLESISRIMCDLVTLQNDLCSYRKDLIKGEDSNVLFILKDRGMSDQEAVDEVGAMLYDCYRRWYEALHNLPFWGEKIDRDVLKFIDGCRNIVLGNLHWSLYTPRYLGNDGPEVKRTRMMWLP